MPTKFEDRQGPNLNCIDLALDPAAGLRAIPGGLLRPDAIEAGRHAGG